MVHRAACPRWLLACAAAISTQRLTCLLCSAVMVSACVPVAAPDSVDGVGEGEGEGGRLRVCLGRGVAGLLADGLALGSVFFADGDGLAVRVPRVR